MRTVLAVDELLWCALRRELPGEAVAVDHMEMRDRGPRGAVKRVRELVMARRSVVVLGGRAWDDPLAFLRALRLQPFVPVVLLLAAGQAAPESMDGLPRIYSIVPTEGGAGLASAIARECSDAWVYAHQRLRPAVTRVLVRDEPRRRLPVLAAILALSGSSRVE